MLVIQGRSSVATHLLWLNLTSVLIALEKASCGCVWYHETPCSHSNRLLLIDSMEELVSASPRWPSPALSSTHQPPPSDQTLRCNTCKQAQPLVAYKSWSVPRVITKNCLHCRNCTRNNRQGSTRRAARSVSVASAVTSDSNATHLSDIDGTYLQPPQPAPPVQPFPPRPFPAPPATQTLAREWEQNPSHQSQRLSDGATLERCLDTWTQKIEVRVCNRVCAEGPAQKESGNRHRVSTI
ncbi:uncharacterized protein UHOD_12117 [Ustilago sp. UG-2017b]|nr:uncharacterized protein UHOD_12117 [Ustilago sp. UG-2017b]